jgi:hypothetical protein
MDLLIRANDAVNEANWSTRATLRSPGAIRSHNTSQPAVVQFHVKFRYGPQLVCDVRAECATSLAANFATGAEIPPTLALHPLITRVGPSLASEY